MAEAMFDPKLPVTDLLARFNMRRGLFRREQIVVKVYALTAQYCVIKTDEDFGPGDSLSLTLLLDMPFENIQLDSVPCVVSSTRKYCSNFFYHLDLKLDPLRTSTSVLGRLHRMIEVIDRKRALENRRSGEDRNNPALHLSGQ